LIEIAIDLPNTAKKYTLVSIFQNRNKTKTRNGMVLRKTLQEAKRRQSNCLHFLPFVLYWWKVVVHNSAILESQLEVTGAAFVKSAKRRVFGQFHPSIQQFTNRGFRFCSRWFSSNVLEQRIKRLILILKFKAERQHSL
jgi:hypothetical protein